MAARSLHVQESPPTRENPTEHHLHEEGPESFGDESIAGRTAQGAIRDRTRGGDGDGRHGDE